jgi:hypothetical protein
MAGSGAVGGVALCKKQQSDSMTRDFPLIVALPNLKIKATITSLPFKIPRCGLWHPYSPRGSPSSVVMGVLTPRAVLLFLATSVAATASSPGRLASTVSDSGKNYFDFETVQLLPADLKTLNESDAALFYFDSADSQSDSTWALRRCKVFPGDTLWPSKTIWSLLDLVTGGGLVKGVPRASTCYSGPAYDAADCEYLTSQWTNSYFQYAPFLAVLCILFNFS